MRATMAIAAAALLSWGVSARAEGVGFAAKPRAEKAGGKVTITFALSGPSDVEVAIVDAGGNNASDLDRSRFRGAGEQGNLVKTQAGKEGGRIVRHLAAGVLGGKSAPPAPLKAGLAQELVWDGKGDWGAEAGAGPFKVRVRAGTGVKFGRTVADSPYNFNETVSRGLAVDQANGDLYVLAKKSRDSALYFLRVYDRTGKYLREIMPYPASLDAKSREVFGQVMAAGMEAPAPMNYYSTWPIFYPVNPAAEGGNEFAYKLLAVHPTDGTVVLVSESFASLYRVRKADGAAVTAPFAEPLWKGTKLAGSNGVGPVMGALAADGKTIFFAGYAAATRKGEKPNPAWPNGRVFKTAVADGGYKGEAFADVALPEDAKPPEHGWNVMGDSQALHGVAATRAGQVLVCDSANGKVWIFAADGKPAGAADVPDAYCVTVNDKTGAVYVLTRNNTVHGSNPKSLVKLDAAKAGAKVVDTLKLADRGGAQDPFLAGDFTGAVPQLWVSGAPREDSVLRIEDQGGKLTVAEDLADRDKTAAGFACRLDVDREADLVYVHNGWAYIYRYNGETGEYAGPTGKDGRPTPLIGSEFCIRRDGMIYLSGNENGGGGFSGQWHRLNRDLTAAPLPGGKAQFSDRYGKMGGGYFGNQGSFVTPDGHLYFNGMFTFRINAIFEVNPDGTPGRGPRLRDPFANAKVAPEVTKGGFNGALVGWLQDESGGVGVDQQGNIYAGIRILPRDYVLPEGVAAVAKKNRHFAESLGCVVKFRPSGGGMVPDSLKGGEKYKIDKAWTYEQTVPEKFEDGIKMAAGQRLDWYQPPRTIHIEGGLRAYPVLAPFSNQCACQTPRFDVDDYGRLYIPNALTCSVQVTDNEGNPIVTFGSYGNFDNQGAASKAAGPAIPLAYPVSARASDKHIYVADSANRRVVRIDPTYAAEETCEVK